MLAVAISHSLAILDHAALKRVSSSTPSTLPLDASPTAIFWSSDNSSLTLSSANNVSSYDLSTNVLSTIYLCPSGDDGPITALVSKDRGNTIVFAQGAQVRVLEAHARRIVQTFDAHKTLVVALALANDASLLASASAGAVHVHNLSHGAHTVLRGLPVGAGEVRACAFHPHARTRLLVGAGATLLVYDTTRPSGPVKSITVCKEKSAGDIVAISSSPFSKTLVAVACSGGFISLVDLEKDKGLCRTISVHVPLTSVTFSGEGATLYAGTENGKVFIQDLRSLDKPPKSITINEQGDRVVAMSMQKKLKKEEIAPKPTAVATSRPLAQQDVNKNPQRNMERAADSRKKVATTGSMKARLLSPITARNLSGKGARETRAAPVESPRLARTRGAPPMARKASAGGVTKRVFSPPKSPLGQIASTEDDKEEDPDISVSIENLLSLQTAKAKENVAPTEIGSGSPPMTTSASRPSSSRTSSHSENGKTRTRVSSSASVATLRTRSVSGGSSRSASSSGKSTKSSASGSSSISSIPPVPAVPAAYKAQARSSLTPSPDLPDTELATPITPLPMGKGVNKGKGKMGAMGVLGLGTPEVDKWIRAGEENPSDEEAEPKMEGRRVGFASHGDDGRRSALSGEDRDETDQEVAEEEMCDAGAKLAVQVTPRRTFAGGSDWAPVPSPLRNLANPHPTSPRSHAAADLLQTLLRDAMYDFRQETRTELVGLHLDMLRMGRGLRSELRSVVDEFRGEISSLQEENRRLREENERLRRGY
ncbi:uncharacterized protein FIBRA_03618 [Fibroporia radiculosa]|uniref:Uncharacterized protein n=1 Tax=Fibroporia radiculosa TaxID=599839 RepID=J4H2I0_9APHY|nr:uncharacterized protein FIBRA_03618 [Fibroporia radiculosa]CCM01559.1 predicted protein [Fibroporia radiculosa]